ncbi:MAG: hypothetical protein NUV97_00365 [archaeon]|nr:hypothetical protein [archaeon]MCR4324004.1 hypothetical protein [Nanoarchaeota archaeon]
MGIDFLEPINNIKLYEFRKMGTVFDEEELRSLLGGLERDLDSVCEERLKTGEFSALDYYINFQVSSEEDFVGMEGSPSLGLGERREAILSIFRTKYKNSFQKVLEVYGVSKRPLDIDVVLWGFRDDIPHELEVLDPNDSS